MTHLDLFSGIGGFALAAKWAGVRTLGFSEIEPHACKVLAKQFPDIPNLGDVTKLCRRAHDCEDRDGEIFCPRCEADFGDCACIGTDSFTDTYGFPDLITAGFPCQPFSVIGKRRATDDSRNLWPETRRILRELRPTWFLGENVAGLVTLALDQVWADLEAEGYACQPLLVPACGVDARHKRERVWILGYALGSGLEGHAGHGGKAPGRKAPHRSTGAAGLPPGRFQRWAPEPDVGRVAHGIPARVDRLTALGNAIVPQVAYEIISAIRHTHETLQ